MSEIAIEASGLTRYYGSKPIVRQVDFAVPRGSVTGLLGLNGTGKTTTIRMLVGLLAPTRGRSAVLGIDSQQLSPSDRARIGFAVEGHFLYNWMSVAACERFQSGTFPRWDSRLFRDTIDRFGISLDAKVSQLSRGQRAGVSLALTLSSLPELLILDDPALGLDPVNRRALNETILDFVQSGDRTALLSSHLLDDVERVADRILIMVNGRIAVDCPLESLVDRVSSCTVELDDDTTELGQIPRLIHARRLGKRCVLTLVDFDSQTQDALERIGGGNLSRNPAAFDEAAIAYLSRSRGSESFFTPSQP